MSWQLHCGNSLEILRTRDDESVDAIVCDPPYGLSQHSADDVLEAIQCWINKTPYTHKGKGFMGKEWDAFVPGPELWRECFRVLKPGGHLLAFSGTRTVDLMGLAIRLAGFESRDTIMCQGLLSWVNSQGFPKSLNVSKALDKSRDGTESARQWEGWGTALKPSWEPVLMFRKPLAEPTVAANVLKHGTGAINVDGTRVAVDSPVVINRFKDGMKPFGDAVGCEYETEESTKGRWPPNFVLCHLPGCKPVGKTTVKNGVLSEHHVRCKDGGNGITMGKMGRALSRSHGDENGDEGVTIWECVEGCPVQTMNQQGGVTKSPAPYVYSTLSLNLNCWGKGIGYKPGDVATQHGDSGYVSRFYPQFEYENDYDPAETITNGDVDAETITESFCYCSKASKSERDAGLQDQPDVIADPYAQHRGRRMETPERFDGKPVKIGKNNHPCVKPIALMAWLCKLVTPPGGTVLDPFMGSGSTGCAAVSEGFNFVGIDLDPDYVEIARKRIAYWKQRGRQRKVSAPPKDVPTMTSPQLSESVTELFS